MYPFGSYPVLATLFQPFRRSQQKTLALASAAIAEAGEASSFSIARHVAAKTGVKVERALRRLDRLLANPRIDDGTLTEAVLGLLARKKARLILAVDWTEWGEDLRLLVASVATGRRALPVQTAALRPSEIRRSQNAFEDAFLRRLARHVRAADFGWVELTRSRPVPVRGVGVWAKGQAEPWWLATNLTDASLAELASLYDRRMSVEEEIRDAKGARFGMKLRWTQFQKPARLARMALLVGVALLLGTALGAAAARRDPSVRMPDKRKGPRLSFAHVGLARLRAGAQRRRRVSGRLVLDHLPGPALRTCTWLEVATAGAP